MPSASVRSANPARSSDGGRSFPSTQTASTDGTWAWTPDIAVDEEGAAWMTWIETGDDGARVTIAAEDDGHVLPGNPIEPAPDEPYTTRANQHLPSITVHRGEVTVAWTDFRNYRWEIWAARGQGCASYDEDRAVFDPDDEVDRYKPEVVLLDGNVVIVYETTDSGRRRVAARVIGL